MTAAIKKFALATLTSMVMSTVFAQHPGLPYLQRQLPDGSKEMNYSQSDGAKVKEILHADGTTTVDVIDPEGNETVMTTNPDGSVESKMNPKKVL